MLEGLAVLARVKQQDEGQAFSRVEAGFSLGRSENLMDNV